MPARKAAKKTTPRKKTTPKSTDYQWVQTSLKYAQKSPTKTTLLGAAAVILILLAFPFRFLVVPAMVNGQPIFSWQYISKLHETSGPQILDQLISEKLVEQEIKKQGIQVTDAEINEQITQIETQFGEESGGLDSILALQGLTRSEFEKQLRLNISLEKLVKGNIEVTPEQIDAEISQNPDAYVDLSEVDAATSAAETVRNNRLQEAFQAWFQQVRLNANIKNSFAPSPPPLPEAN